MLRGVLFWNNSEKKNSSKFLTFSGKAKQLNKVDTLYTLFLVTSLKKTIDDTQGNFFITSLRK